MDKEHEDQLAALRAVVDQMLEGTKEIARVVHGYFSSLVELGLSEEQALELTHGWQEHILRLASPHRGE